MAVDEAEMLRLVRDFVAQFSQHEIDQLSPGCRPGKFLGANDVTSYAFALVQHNCEANARVPAVAHRLVAFFSEASVRLSELMPPTGAAQRESRNSE